MVPESGITDPVLPRVTERLSAPPAASLPAPGASGFLRALGHCWGRALLVGLAVATVAVAGCWLALPVPVPTVTARLRFSARPEDDPAALRRDLVALACDADLIAASFGQDEVSDPATLRADAPAGGTHVDLTLTGARAPALAAAVNALAEAVVREAGSRERRARAERLADAEAKWRIALEQVREPRARLRGLAGAGDASPRAKRADAERELRETRSRKAAAERELALLQARDKTPPPVAEGRFADDEILRPLAATRARLLEEIEHLRGLALPGKTPPALTRALEELADIDRRIRTRRDQLAARSGVAPASPTADLAAIALIRNQIATLAEREKSLADDMRRLEEESRSLADAAKDVDRTREASAAAEASAERAKAEVKAREQELAAPPRVTAEEWAEAPPPQTARRAGAAALAGACAVLVVLLGYGWQEYRTCRVHQAEDVGQAGGLCLFGTLPDAPATVKRRLAGVSPKPGDPGTRLLSEALDAVRTRLLYEAETRGLNVVLVTSAVGGEGKTSLASQLAISLARAWRRTLLLDADMRKPGAHRLFGLGREPGFSDVLCGEAELDAVLHATPISRLWTVPAGTANDHALQALAQDVGPLLAELKSRYDFVIIDCPPVLPVADALMLGQHVDGVLLSVLRGTSRLPLVHEARRRLHALGIPVLGAVVAGVPGEVYATDDRPRAPAPKKPAA